MPVVGERKNSQKINRNYANDNMHAVAEEFLNVARGALQESGVDIFTEPQKFFMHNSTKNDLKQFFMNEMYDPNDPEMKDPEKIEDFEESLDNLFQNDIEAISESAPLGAFNPVIGTSIPMHKNLLQTLVFDKGAIPKAVAASPKFTETLETRTLVDVNGNKIDMFYNQDKIHDAIKNSVPQQDVYLPIPEVGTTDVIGAFTPAVTGHLSIITYVAAIVVSSSYCDVGDMYYDPADATNHFKTATTAGDQDHAVIKINKLEFQDVHGQYDRALLAHLKIATATGTTPDADPIDGVLQGIMQDDKFTMTFAKSSGTKNIEGIVLHAVMDVSSAAYDEPYVEWSAKSWEFDIPEAPHIATSVSPEEVKDVNALYQVNQLTKIMSMMNLSLANYKDDEIRQLLNESYLHLDDTQRFSGAFDFVPPTNYLADPISWRQTMFMDYLDTITTNMLQVLNDENMTITVFGRPDLIRKITPTEYTYQTPSAIGPVKLDYTKTVVTSDKRVYQFISSQKLRNNNTLIIILCPRNTNRIIYKIYDYQFYVSNEIRTTKGYQLPAITAFERWKMIEFQPVQARVEIVNPTGLREVLDTSNPIGTTAMNDYTSYGNTYASTINGASTGTNGFNKTTAATPGVKVPTPNLPFNPTKL